MIFSKLCRKWIVHRLMSICIKLGNIYSYVKESGYIPVLRLTNCYNTIYYDEEGEDVWAKFFEQPEGVAAQDWTEAACVYESPCYVPTFSGFWLARQISGCGYFELRLSDYFNERVKQEINKERERIGLYPKQTLGVLCRGTDFKVTHLPGHAIMAAPEQIVQKITDDEAAGGRHYEYIFLSTEDIDVLERMKELCGERLLYTNQKRFRINEGELLYKQKREREKEGWLKGVEYLTTLQLLSECDRIIISGHCAGAGFVQVNNEENQKEIYVFDLGVNP